MTTLPASPVPPPPSRMSTRLIVTFLAASVLIGGALYYFFGRGHGGQGPGMAGFAMPVEITPAKAETIVVAIDTVGTVLADEEVVIRPEIAGRVASIAFEEGANVRKGDVLITIDDAIYAADLKQAEAQAELARANFARARKLKASGTATVRTFDEANAAQRTAEGAFALARARHDKTKIVAPFDGVVGLRKVSVGDYVNVGQDIVNFAKIEPLKVDFRIPETYLGRVKTGQKAEIRLDAFPGETFSGDIYALDPVIDTQGRSLGARAHLPNEGQRLRPGQFAKVHILLETRENATVIPEEAVVPEGSDAFVFVADQGKAKKVKVVLGERRSGTVEVREGVKPGDAVITGGQIKIQEGMPVQDAAAMMGGKPPAEGAAKPEEKSASEPH